MQPQRKGFHILGQVMSLEQHLSPAVCVLAVVSCRQMCGVHYRMDSEEGLLLGEIVGVRMLQQVREYSHTLQMDRNDNARGTHRSRKTPTIFGLAEPGPVSKCVVRKYHYANKAKPVSRPSNRARVLTLHQLSLCLLFRLYYPSSSSPAFFVFCRRW